MKSSSSEPPTRSEVDASPAGSRKAGPLTSRSAAACDDTASARLGTAPAMSGNVSASLRPLLFALSYTSSYTRPTTAHISVVHLSGTALLAELEHVEPPGG